MSQTVFDRNDFIKSVPKNILERTKENMEVYNLSLTDAFQEATRTLAKKGTELWKAWYYDDFRKFIPSVYNSEYLDFFEISIKICENNTMKSTFQRKENKYENWR